MLLHHCLVWLLIWVSWPIIALSAEPQLTAIADVTAVPNTQHMHERLGHWAYRGKKSKVFDETGIFIEYTPAQTIADNTLPLIIFLHGAGGRAELKNISMEKLYAEFLLAEIRGGRELNARVLCPQAWGYWGGDATDFVMQALAHYKGSYDPDRVYLTGLSSGGGGCWEAAVNCHDYLAAAVPVCGIKKNTDRDNELINLPIWAFHNTFDPYQSVHYTRDHVAAIKAAGGKYIYYTEYAETPGKHHQDKDGKDVYPGCHPQAWIAAYTDEKMWQWLFKQRRGQPALSLMP